MSARILGGTLACGLLMLLPLSGAVGAPRTGVETPSEPRTGVESPSDPRAGVESPPEPRPGTAHELHLAYGDLAVEGTVIAGRIRFFKDDLERALGPMVDATSMTLTPGPEADALVMRYVRENLKIEVGGQELEPSLLSSGEDDLDREPMWWVIVQYRSPVPPDPIRVINTLLFDVFDDQRNVFKFVHFPDETQRTFYFAEGESEHIVRF